LLRGRAATATTDALLDAIDLEAAHHIGALGADAPGAFLREMHVEGRAVTRRHPMLDRACRAIRRGDLDLGKLHREMVGEEQIVGNGRIEAGPGSSPEKLVAAGTIQARCAEAAVGRANVAAVASRAKFRKRMRVSPFEMSVG
jgi:hypothetical protein